MVAFLIEGEVGKTQTRLIHLEGVLEGFRLQCALEDAQDPQFYFNGAGERVIRPRQFNGATYITDETKTLNELLEKVKNGPKTWEDLPSFAWSCPWCKKPTWCEFKKETQFNHQHVYTMLLRPDRCRSCGVCQFTEEFAQALWFVKTGLDKPQAVWKMLKEATFANSCVKASFSRL